MRQTTKPDKIIVWLAKEQFENIELPESVVKMQSRGLEIEYVNDDLKSHKKYYYAMLKYPNDNIITADDDFYFDNYFIENLIVLHKKYPNCKATNRAHEITFNSTGEIDHYRKWKHNVTNIKPSKLLLATGGAGTLYPPNSLHNDAFNVDLMKKLCFNADDIWLKIMSLKKNKYIVTNERYNKDFINVKNSQKTKLVDKNVFNNGNDIQLIELCKHYSLDIISLFK